MAEKVGVEGMKKYAEMQQQPAANRRILANSLLLKLLRA